MTATTRILPGTAVRVSDAPIRVGDIQALRAMNPPPGDSSPPHETTLRVEHDAAGNVARIHVQCRCGEESVIVCEYADRPASQGA